MKVRVRYFAALREQTGIHEEVRETAGPTAQELYEEIRSEYGVRLSLRVVRSSVNGEFVAHDHGLSEGDEVVFIPPVAGG